MVREEAAMAVGTGAGTDRLPSENFDEDSDLTAALSEYEKRGKSTKIPSRTPSEGIASYLSTHSSF